MTREAAIRKMPKARRRDQLLGTAQAIVREEGTEALTLGRLAERAGVSKPIAYGHFGTRSGLLMALCRDYDDRHLEAMRAILKSGGNSLEQVAEILSSAYIGCVLTTGPEFGAIFAALFATAETDDFRQMLREAYIAEYRSALAPFVTFPKREGDTILAGLLGAAEALSQDAASGRVSHDEAFAALALIFKGTLGRYASSGAA